MRTEALVIRTWPFSESTLIVSLLTADHGVVRAIAKGARRLKGRTAAAFEFCAYVHGNLRVGAGDRLGSLTSVTLRRAWPCLRENLMRLALASVALELLEEVASVSPPDPFFLEEALAYLEALETTEAPGSLTALVLLRLLHHAGHPPQVASELRTGPAPDRVLFSFRQGTFQSERPGKAIPEGGVARFPGELFVRLLPALLAMPPLDGSFVIPDRHGPRVLTWLVRLWEGHLSRKLSASSFLEKTFWRPGGRPRAEKSRAEPATKG